jgi:hypothetical protein
MTPALATALIALIGSLSAYLKAHTENSQIRQEREQTAKERDAANELIAYKVEQCEKRLDKTDPKIDQILSMLTDIKVELAKKAEK